MSGVHKVFKKKDLPEKRDSTKTLQTHLTDRYKVAFNSLALLLIS